jgi:hypothetical protein
MKLTGGAHMVVTFKSEGVIAEMRKVKGNTLWANTPRLLGPNGLSMDPTVCGA